VLLTGRAAEAGGNTAAQIRGSANGFKIDKAAGVKSAPRYGKTRNSLGASCGASDDGIAEAAVECGLGVQRGIDYVAAPSPVFLRRRSAARGRLLSHFVYFLPRLAYPAAAVLQSGFMLIVDGFAQCLSSLSTFELSLRGTVCWIPLVCPHRQARSH